MPDVTPLPRLVTRGRRGLLTGLVVVAVLHAATAVVVALLVGRLVGAGSAGLGPLLGATVLVLACMAGTKYAERVLAERLGQDYVHELRGRLVEAALSGARGPSLGITLARATNDLSSIRNWVAQGIAPLVAAVPLVLGSVLALGWLHWGLAAATLLPLLGLALVLGVKARTAYQRARSLRRHRGRLAARLSDTLHARDAILTGGGRERELRRIERDSTRVVDAAVARSRVAGLLQATAMTTAAAMAALVVLAGRTAGVNAGAVATALTIAGVLAAPLGETGRIVEYRQNYRAARRVLGPHLAAQTAVASTAAPPGSDVRPSRSSQTSEGDGVRITLRSRSPHPRPIEAAPGECLRVVGRDTASESTMLAALAMPTPRADVTLDVDGEDQAHVPTRRRREIVGTAARGTALERGTIARAVRYRRPDLDVDEARRALVRVGLANRVAMMDKGERTELRRGGEPLTTPELARLKVARAIVGDPRLLILDHIDHELDDDGRAMLAELVATYPGVVVFASDQPDRVASEHRTLELAGRVTPVP